MLDLLVLLWHIIHFMKELWKGLMHVQMLIAALFHLQRTRTTGHVIHSTFITGTFLSSIMSMQTMRMIQRDIGSFVEFSDSEAETEHID